MVNFDFFRPLTDQLLVLVDQGWATLLALRATLETSKVSAGQYMYNKANN